MFKKNLLATLAVSSACLFVSSEAYLDTDAIIQQQAEKAADELLNGQVPTNAVLSNMGAKLNEQETAPEPFTWGFDETKFTVMSIKGGPFNADGFHKETGQTGLAFYKTHLTPVIEAVVGYSDDTPDDVDSLQELYLELEDDLEDAADESASESLYDLLQETTAVMEPLDPCLAYEEYTNQELVDDNVAALDMDWAVLDCDGDGYTNGAEIDGYAMGKKWDPYVAQVVIDTVITIDLTSQVYNYMISLSDNLTPQDYFDTCTEDIVQGVDYVIEYQSLQQGTNTTADISSFFGTANNKVAQLKIEECTGEIIAHSAELNEKAAAL